MINYSTLAGSRGLILHTKLLPKIKVDEGAVVRSGGLIGWGIRKDSPMLEAELKDYYINFMKKEGTIKLAEAGVP